MNDLIKAIEEDSGNILFNLRRVGGLDRPTLRRLLDTIDKLGKMYAENDQIPKAAAAIFFDIYPAMMAASYEYSRSQQLEIMQVADELADHIRSVLNVPRVAK